MEDDGYLTHGLCPSCFSLDFASPDLSYGTRPVADIIAGCRIGCTFCGLLTFSLDLKWCMVDAADNSILSVSLSRGDEHGGPGYQDCIIAAVYGYHLRHGTATFDITVLHGECEEEPILPLAPRITSPESGKSASILKRSFDWVKTQLDECTAYHICGGTSEMPLPTRVLDLGEKEAPDVRLIVPEEGAEGNYAALSYCWGRSNHFVLTAATMGNLKNGFNVCQLPKTLQDAVKVTRNIGLRYLWIDALCIIQGKDSEATNDWNKEVAKMDAVYGNAVITISAAAAQNASGGLFRGSHCELPFITSLTTAGDKNVVIWARVTWRNYVPAFKSEPINSRAWALQEDLLSTRVLFFASFGLLWKCNEEIICGYSGDSRSRSPTALAKTGRERDTDDTHFQSLTSRYMFTIPRYGNLMATSWRQNLELYTARNLTNPHDKLPALAAIAQRYSRCIGPEYLAGLWKSFFRQELLWRRIPGNPLITVSDEGNPMRGNEYRAPSWSWAAVDGVVTNEWALRILETEQWHAEVTVYPIPVLVDPRNPFGGIVKMSAQLQMRGPMETFKVLEHPKRHNHVDIRSAKDRRRTGTLYLDDFTESAPWRSKKTESQFRRWASRITFQIFRGRSRNTQSLFCLHIVTDTESSGRSSHALALLRVREQKDTYIRIGEAVFYGDSIFRGSHPEAVTIQTVTIL